MRLTKFVLLAALLLCANLSFAQVSATQQQALNVIAAFADRLCTTVGVSGKSSEWKTSVEGRVEVSGLVKKIANLGFKGAAEYGQKNWEGVLQADLAKLLSANASCRDNVFNRLEAKLIVPEAAPLPYHQLLLKRSQIRYKARRIQRQDDSWVTQEFRNMVGTISIGDTVIASTVENSYTESFPGAFQDSSLKVLQGTHVALIQLTFDYKDDMFGEMRLSASCQAMLTVNGPTQVTPRVSVYIDVKRMTVTECSL